MKSSLFAVAIALCVASGLCAPCAGKSIVIEQFDAAVDVATDGAIEIEETIRLRFTGSWNGIRRSIPVVYRTPRGDAYRLRLTVQRVTDDAGRPLKFERSRERQAEELKIFVPQAADAVRTVAIRYRVQGGLRFFGDHDELYWNVTGDEWPYPIAAARTRVRLPGEVANVRVNAFTGAVGSTERSVAISVDGVRRAADDVFAAAGESPPPAGGRHVIDVEATRPLGIREGLTVAVGWNAGVVYRPSQAERWRWWLSDNLRTGAAVAGLLAVPLAVGGVLFSRWRRRGRDPQTGPIVVRYEPPDGLGPAEAGTLLDHSADMRDIMAMVVDLAVKGCIRIRETTSSGWFGHAAYAFDLLRPQQDWRDLAESERRLLSGLFSSGDAAAAKSLPEPPAGTIKSVTTDDLQQRFHAHLPGICSAVFDRLVEKGCYVERPDRVTGRHLIGAVIAMGVMFFVGPLLAGIVFAASVFLNLNPVTVTAAFILAVLLTIAVVIAFGTIRPPRTKRGAEALAAVRGFQEFLTRVESHRFASMPLTPELFERYLPYAMALGVEGRWAQAFEGICRQPPDWYVGSGPVGSFHSADLAGGLGRMSAVASSAMQSAPRSSGGSGFGGSGGSGGGSSGGGFGGGGGSGF